MGCLFAVACGDDGDAESQSFALASACGEASGDVPALRLTEVAGGLDLPTFMAPVPGADRLVVLEQEGLIRAVEGGALAERPFADLTDRVYTRLPAYSEWGLLGLAFHPDFEENGRVFVHYSSVATSGAAVGDETLDLVDGDGVISEFAVDAEGLLDVTSERRLMVVPQPELNHNGGSIEFSPSDGYLYIGLGDGGGQGDPNGNAQDLSTWLGKMLRVDVDGGALLDSGRQPHRRGRRPGDLELRPPQPLAVQLRPLHLRSVRRRRGAEPAGGGRRRAGRHGRPQLRLERDGVVELLQRHARRPRRRAAVVYQSSRFL